MEFPFLDYEGIQQTVELCFFIQGWQVVIRLFIKVMTTKNSLTRKINLQVPEVGLPLNNVPAGRVCQTLLSLSVFRFCSKGIF